MLINNAYLFIYLLQKSILIWKKSSAKRVWTFTRNSLLEWPGSQSSSKWRRWDSHLLFWLARDFIKRAPCNIFVLHTSQQVGIDRGDIPDLSQVRLHFYSDFNTCTRSALLTPLSISWNSSAFSLTLLCTNAFLT